MPHRLMVIKERANHEKRVALDPNVVKKFSQLKLDIHVETTAGNGCYFNDDVYQAHATVETLSLAQADIITCVQAPSLVHIKQMKAGSVVVGLLNPYLQLDVVKALAEQNVTALAMEFIPRISRAQSMDALSSQASIAGYEGALMAASLAPRLFPMLTTAAGTIRPANVVVIGAGVAGLQAIATARRLGAQVSAYDIRPAAKEQVESLGAKLIDTGVDASGSGGYARTLTAEEEAKQAEVLQRYLSAAHAVISTAAVPGRAAPRIITKTMVEKMQKGSVIIDLAAETGGNCELSVAGKTHVHQGVTIAAPLNVPSQAAVHASELYANNIFNLLSPFIKEGELVLDFEDEIIKACMITHQGQVVSERLQSVMEK